jgi:metal-sulfur cluster biosynthetic enzyme
VIVISACSKIDAMEGIPLQNANPRVFAPSAPASSSGADVLLDDDDDDVDGALVAAASAASSPSSLSSPSPLARRRDPIDRAEVFELIRHLNDPEHPLTLEQLNVASLDLIEVRDEPGGGANASTVDVRFTPTIPHCSMATLIGLSIRVKLLRALPPRFKVTVRITPGAHASEEAVNKQLADKERVAAALENGNLLDVVNKCVRGTDRL